MDIHFQNISYASPLAFIIHVYKCVLESSRDLVRFYLPLAFKTVPVANFLNYHFILTKYTHQQYLIASRNYNS